MAMEQVAGAQRDMMLPVTPVLAFSAWLVAQSKATPSASTISIFLKLPGVIPPGGSTPICCSCTRMAASSVPWSCVAAGPNSPSLMPPGRNRRLQLPLPGWRHQFRPPSTHPLCPAWAGGGCRSFHDFPLHHHTLNAGCFLYLEGQVKALDFLPKERDDSNLSHVHQGNGGRCTCRCFTEVALVERSPVSQPVDLTHARPPVGGQGAGDASACTCQPQGELYVSSQPGGTGWLAVAAPGGSSRGPQ
ncbi:unnamed protein product [Bubo scandiacus]